MRIHNIRSTDESGTLTYVVEDTATKKAVIIDANISDIDTIQSLVQENGLGIVAIIDTHTHADHVTGAGELKKVFKAPYVMHSNTKDKWKAVELGKSFGIEEILRSNTAIGVDRFVDEGDTISIGNLVMKVIHTPGHTDNHIALQVEDALFTGDLLLIGQAGRSDLPGGSPSDQYKSLYGKIMELPGDAKIYPGHDYEGNEYSLLRDEIRENPFLQRVDEADYVNFVKEYFPPLTDTGEGGQVVLQCGTQRVKTANEKYMDVTPQQLQSMMKADSDLFLLDVREPSELVAFGSIPGVINISNKSLSSKMEILPRDRAIVVICQSGGRSTEAAHLLTTRGFAKVYNLLGGTGGWITQGLPVEHRSMLMA